MGWGDLFDVARFHDYLESVVYPKLYLADTFDGDNSFPTNSSRGSLLNSRGSLNGHGKVLGAIRLSQARSRVQPNCTVVGQVPGDALCVMPYGAISEDRTTYGLDGSYVADSKFGYGKGSNYLAPLSGITYYTGPFVVYLDNPAITKDPEGVLKILKGLRENGWVDLKTKVIFIDINIYNPSTRRWVLMRFVAEFLDGGGLKTGVQVVPLQLFDPSLSDRKQAGKVALIVIFYLFVLGYSFEALRDLYRNPLSVFQIGVFFNVINLAIFWTSLYYMIMSWTTAPLELDLGTNSYIETREKMKYLSRASDFAAFNAFFTITKLLKYMNYIPSFRTLLSTFADVYESSIAFLLICILTYFATSQAFHVMLGDNLYQYRSLKDSFYSLFQMSFGVYDYESMRWINPIGAPIIFFMFIILVVFILMNMFVAILLDGFQRSRERDSITSLSAKQAWDDIINTMEYYLLDKFLFNIPILGPYLVELHENVQSKLIPALLSMAENSRLVEAIDKDGDGLSLEEMKAYFDKNNDGDISLSEMKQGLLATGISAEKAGKIIDTLNFNEDNKIQASELTVLAKGTTLEAREEAAQKEAAQRRAKENVRRRKSSMSRGRAGSILSHGSNTTESNPLSLALNELRESKNLILAGQTKLTKELAKLANYNAIILDLAGNIIMFLLILSFTFALDKEGGGGISPAQSRGLSESKS
jgi:hypothetical protein